MSETGGVWSLLLRSAGRFPERTAAVEGGRHMTYAGLLRRVRSLGAHLRIKGFGKRDKVGLLLPNSIEFVVSFFAASGIGAVSVPINPAYTEDEIRFYVEHGSLRLLVTSTDLAGVAVKVTEGTGAEVMTVKGDSADWVFDTEALAPEVEEDIAPDDEAVYLYSTGSTGSPKRVGRTHANLTALAFNHTETIGWSEEDRVLFTVPLSHTYGFGNFLGAVKVGASMYMIGHMAGGFKRGEVIEVIERESITVFPAVPFMLGILTDTHLQRKADFSSLRMALSAGAPLTGDVYTKFRDKFGVQPRQLYGSTETGVIAINMSEDVDTRFDSVGRPVANVDVRVVGPDGSERGVDERGEITVRSPSMTTSYYDLPEETARVFKGGYYHTGDIGRVDSDGYIYIEGREKLVINVAGNKVDPAEVEAVLCAHPAVKEAAVVGIADEGGAEVVKAVIVLEGELERAEVVQYLKGRLSGFKIPRVLEFRDEIPRSPTGKVLRERLR